MYTVKVIGRGFAVGPGTPIGLTKAQVAARAHEIDKVEGRRGVYTARAVQQFKVGELIGLDEIAKGQRDMVEIDDEEENAERAREELRARRAAAAEAERQRKGEIAMRNAELTAAYDASDDLKARFSTVEAYIESVPAES